MLRALIAGVDGAEALANLARGLLRKKLPQLRKALTGQVTDHHRFLLQLHLDHLTHLEALIGQLEGRIGAEMEKGRPPEPPPDANGGAGPASPAGPAPNGGSVGRVVAAGNDSRHQPPRGRGRSRGGGV